MKKKKAFMDLPLSILTTKDDDNQPEQSPDLHDGLKLKIQVKP